MKHTSIVLSLAVAASVPSGAGAQGTAGRATYPSHPIRLIVPWPPGGTADALARIVGQQLYTTMGQQIVVDQRPGAGSTIGVGLAAKAIPDGYTLLYTDITTMAVNASLYQKLPYDGLRDLAPISMVGSSILLLVTQAAAVPKSVKELIAMARADPGAFSYSSAGNGSALHLAGEMFRLAAGIQLTHVPYKGGGPAMTALLAGEVHLNFAGAVAAMPHIKAGALRALATTRATRAPALPDVPAVAELYPGFQILLVNGMLAPTGVPQQIIARLNAEIRNALAKPEVAQRFDALGVEPWASAPEELTTFLKTEIGRFGKVVRETGAKVD